MFPLSHMMKAFIAKGRLTVIDADGNRHVFEGEPGPAVTMRLTDRKLYRSLVFNAELAAGEAYMDGTMRFEEGSTLRDFLQLFSINRLSLGSYPIRKPWDFQIASVSSCATIATWSRASTGSSPSACSSMSASIITTSSSPGSTG